MLTGISSLFLFLFILVYYLALLLFHNTFKKHWWSGCLIIISVFFVTAQIQTTMADWILFAVGGIAYLLLDTLADYKQHWRYNTKSGYVFWAGPAWGLLTLVVFILTANISFVLAAVLFFLSLLIIFSKRKKTFQIKNYSGSPWIPFAFVCVFVSPSLFLVSLAIGIIFEYIAVEVFKTWSYPKPVYGLIGVGYGTMMVYLQMVLEIVSGTTSLINVLFVISLTLFVILHKLGVLQKKK